MTSASGLPHCRDHRSHRVGPDEPQPTDVRFDDADLQAWLEEILPEPRLHLDEALSRWASWGGSALELDERTADPAALPDPALIECTVGLERMAAWAQARQARLFRARDVHCRFPTCRQPATRADLDHTTPTSPPVWTTPRTPAASPRALATSMPPADITTAARPGDDGRSSSIPTAGSATPHPPATTTPAIPTTTGATRSARQLSVCPAPDSDLPAGRFTSTITAVADPWLERSRRRARLWLLAQCEPQCLPLERHP